MKKYGTIIALGLAILFGVAAVWLANKWMTTRPVEDRVVLKEAMPLSTIVIASKSLDIGTLLTPENLTLTDWPKAHVPMGAFESIADLEGRVAVTKLVAGEPVLAAELAAPGSGAGLVAVIPQGKRAMSIRVDEVIGVAGFILPNTFVDVIAVGSSETGNKRVVKTILKRIRALAIAQETFTEEGKAKVVRTVTLELNPKETETLALQTHQGTIHLVLRNPLEEEEEKIVPEKKKVVKKKAVPVFRPRVVTPKPSPFDVEVIRGSERKTETFKNVESEEIMR